MGKTSDIAGIAARHAGCRLTISLDALVANWTALSRVCAPATTACVVKADAYGLGAAKVVPALAAAGCNTFFVALPHEGIGVRRHTADARIFVLNPLLDHGIESDFAEHALIPCLNSASDAAAWGTYCGATGRDLPCAVSVDTGMNRLGMSEREALSFAEENGLTRAVKPVLLMSHLACADDPSHAKNREQFESFQRVAAVFEGVETSLVNSAGIFLGRDWHGDVTRPGIAIYGGSPVNRAKNPMRTVVTAEARIAQVRYAKAGETVSYGATQVLGRDTAIAVCALGYADGLHRSASGSGVPLRSAQPSGGFGFVAGKRVPILGRITMDLVMFDVTDCGPGAVGRGDWVELFGHNLPLDEAAAASGTIAYELLTSLGQRYHREYIGVGAHG